MEEVKTFKPTKLCAECGGVCCKKIACHYAPSDFSDLSFEGLKREIEKGKISIDWWENTLPEYYLRARHVGGNVVDGAWCGRCINLTPEGCSLSWEERPLGGKALEPINKKCCKSHYTKEQCKNDWKPYADTLEALVDYYSALEKPKSAGDKLYEILQAYHIAGLFGGEE